MWTYEIIRESIEEDLEKYMGKGDIREWKEN